MSDYPNSPALGRTDTSASAAPSQKKASELHALIRRRLELKGGMTADEIAADLGQSILAIRPRVTECGLLGLIRKTTLRRRSSTGHSSTVWAAA